MMSWHRSKCFLSSLLLFCSEVISTHPFQLFIRVYSRLASQISSAADKLRRALQQDALAGPADNLRSARSMNIHRRVSAPGSDRCNCGGTRSCARGLRLSNTTLVEARLNIISAFDPHKLYVDAVLEIVVTANLRGFALPGWRKLFYENNIVWISHGDWRAMHLAKGYFDGKIVAYLRLAHIHLKREVVAVARNHFATFKASAGTYRQVALATLINKIGSHAARAVA